MSDGHGDGLLRGGPTMHSEGKGGNLASLSQKVDVEDSGPYGNITGGVALVQGGADVVMNLVIN